MNIQEDVINALKTLPCFDEIQTVNLLANGLSQTSLKITTKSKTFFAKKLNAETADVEISCALLCSQKATKGDLNEQTHQLSPTVVYHDKEWLVTEFIAGSTLAETKIDLETKVSITLTLMAKLHRLSAAAIEPYILQLDTNLSVSRLLAKPMSLLTRNSHIVDNVAESLTCAISQIILASDCPSVLCHGDMNFTNILTDKLRNPWLIDYECAHKAPAEFDLAMFIAVNNIPTKQIKGVVTAYTKLNQAHNCNDELLNLYILYSFFINGLWYLDNKDVQSDSLFQKLAHVQWSSFDNFAIDRGMKLPKLLPLLT
jgi:thiamine kinase-like enzyme